jgi:outer membrane protein assembly factor BamB
MSTPSADLFTEPGPRKVEKVPRLEALSLNTLFGAAPGGVGGKDAKRATESAHRTSASLIAAPLRSVLQVLCIGMACTAACQDGSTVTPPTPRSLLCRIDQPPPYADSSYVSNHADAENTNYVACRGPLSFEPDWYVLRTHLAAQPNTFSIDGGVTYVTTTPGSDGSTVHAVETQTGRTKWQRSDFTLAVAASSVEVAHDGLLYVSDRATVSCLRDVDGALVWSATLPDKEEPGLTYGLKLTPGDHVVTQVSNGTVYLLDRFNGAIEAMLDVAARTGYVPPAPQPVPVSLMPPFMRSRFALLLGTDDPDALEELIAGLFGASGAFADNTVCVTRRGQVFTVGGGPTPETGALVAIDILGEDEHSPSLELAWTAELRSGSASSVVALNGGERVVLADGAGTIHLYDAEACDRNVDTDPDPRACHPAWTFEQPGTVPGALSVDPRGHIYFIVGGKGRRAAAYGLEDRGDRAELLWERRYDEGEQFSTVLTVTENAIYGLLTRVEPLEVLGRPVYLPGIPMPLPAAPILNRAVALDPETGEIVWSVPAPNSSITELIPSPTGDLFLTMAGGAEILVADPEAPDPQAGLMRLRPAGVVARTE